MTFRHFSVLSIAIVQILGLQEIFTTVGRSLTLHCPYHSLTEAVIWRGPPELRTLSINNKLDIHSDEMSIVGNVSSGEYNLLILEFRKQDEGLYQCDTVANGTTAEHEILVSVAEPPVNLTVVNETASRIIYGTEGLPLILTCTVQNGNPPVTLYWLHRLQVKAWNVSHIVFYNFTPAKYDHLEYFKCVANNSYFEIEKEAQLVLNLKPEVEIDEIFVTVQEYQSFNLTCKIKSNTSLVTIFWHHNGVMLLGQKKEFLSIHNVTRFLAGVYSCTANNTIGVAMDIVNVSVQYSPSSDQAEYHYAAQTGTQVNISIILNSNPRPDIAWTNNVGGKLGFWRLILENETLFRAVSTIFPVKEDDIGTYGIRVRNAVGSLNLAVNLVGSTVKVFPDQNVCNTSSGITLVCTISSDVYDGTTLHNTWTHQYDRTEIRMLPGRIYENTSTLTISFCDYRDAGLYVCKWTSGLNVYTGKAVVFVNGRPIPTSQGIIHTNALIQFKLYFYAVPKPTTVTWHYKDKRIIDENATYLTETSIVLNIYEHQITIDGYITALSVMKRTQIIVEDYSCQVQNDFGVLDTSFSPKDIVHISENVSFTQNVHDFECSDIRNPCFTINPLSKENIHTVNAYVITISATVAVLFVAVLIVFLNQLRIIRKGKSRKPNERDESRRNEQGEEISIPSNPVSEPSYEEINSAYYHTVEWRNYNLEEDDADEHIEHISLQSTNEIGESAKHYYELQNLSINVRNYNQFDELTSKYNEWLYD